jgi:hypothetical protein
MYAAVASPALRGPNAPCTFRNSHRRHRRRGPRSSGCRRGGHVGRGLSSLTPVQASRYTSNAVAIRAQCSATDPETSVRIDSGESQPDADFVAGVPPSDNDRLEAIRAYADRAMRYYATAFLRETDENRELMQAYMGITASILALLDRDALDDRSMMTGREEIIQQYVEQARSDPYEPGNCSFCGERPVAAWFEGPSFRTFVRSSAEVRAEEAWLACATCLALVEANDREGLAERDVERLRRRDRDEGRQRGPSEEALMLQMKRDQQEKQFWRPRQG